MSSSEEEDVEVYIYNGVDEVPRDVTHVRVEPSVTVIPENAFRYRHYLEEVELPEGLIRIGDKAFYYCSSALKRINLPSTLEEIGDHTFDQCENLEVVLPEGIERLGQWAFQNCRLKRINIPPLLEVINEGTFCNCDSLSEISFSEGLREIGKDALSRCTSFVSIKLPSSLKVIGIEAFEGCERLNEIRLPDTIEIIRARAFKICNLTNFRIPPSIGVDVDISIVGSNISLVSLELPETIEQLEDKYASREEQCTVLSVRNIALPSDCEIDTVALKHCADLGLAFPDADDDDNDATISAALKRRFDDLPIHKICYYQSYHDTKTTVQNLKREINPWTSKPPGQLNITGNEHDCLGMTPLHILACSTKPAVEMFQLLIDKYPETLIMKDKWGDIPLLYAFWCNAPSEVVDMLVEGYKSLHPEYEFDWKGMLETLAKRRLPLKNIQRLFNTQQHNFPDQDYDMKSLVMELATHDTQESFGRCEVRSTSIEVFRYLFRASITKRMDALAVAKWRVDLENRIVAFAKKTRESDTKALYDRLDMYELAKEASSILELALWKHKMDEFTLSIDAKSVGQSNKRARVDTNISERQQYRINCGANVVVRNVLPYLLPK